MTICEIKVNTERFQIDSHPPLCIFVLLTPNNSKVSSGYSNQCPGIQKRVTENTFCAGRSSMTIKKNIVTSFRKGNLALLVKQLVQSFAILNGPACR